MAGAIVNKIWEAMGLNAHNEDEEYYEDDEVMEEEQPQEEVGGFFKRNKVVNMHLQISVKTAILNV